LIPRFPPFSLPWHPALSWIASIVARCLFLVPTPHTSPLLPQGGVGSLLSWLFLGVFFSTLRGFGGVTSVVFPPIFHVTVPTPNLISPTPRNTGLVVFLIFPQVEVWFASAAARFFFSFLVPRLVIRLISCHYLIFQSSR